MAAYLIFMTWRTLLTEYVLCIIMLSAVLSNCALHRFLFSAGSSVITNCSASNMMLWLA